MTVKVSEITIKNLANYLKLDYGSLAEEEILEVAAFLQAAIRFICDYTGLPEADLDEHETFIIAVLRSGSGSYCFAACMGIPMITGG